MRKIDYSPDTDALIQKMQTLCRSHQMLYDGEPVCPYTLKLLCSVMAEQWLCLNDQSQKHTILFKFDDDPAVLKDKEHRQLFFLQPHE